jgi:endonuclease/exonuclease/phosphatase (EEP) superfamily protein YafD
MIWVGGVSAILATLLPFLRTDWWWVRVLDFPRLQVGVLAAVTAILALLVLDRRRRRVRALFILLLASFGYQSSEVYPFTFLASKQVEATAGCPETGRVSLLIANVLMTNRRAEPLLRLVQQRDPDLVLATETDRWWDHQLQRLAARYPHAVRYPLDNTYGIHLYSKLALEEPEVCFLVQEGIPSIRARLRMRSGTLVEFHAVHPTPPQPQRDTTPRDYELILVGRQVNGDGRPTIVAGDLNDVGWSDTTRQFKEVSGLLDPRVGRGLYATFNANWPLMRWPLDHVFVDRSFRLLRLAREGDIGSDHFPIYVEVCRQ